MTQFLGVAFETFVYFAKYQSSSEIFSAALGSCESCDSG
jgi:hypothetical protein